MLYLATNPSFENASVCSALLCFSICRRKEAPQTRLGLKCQRHKSFRLPAHAPLPFPPLSKLHSRNSRAETLPKAVGRAPGLTPNALRGSLQPFAQYGACQRQALAYRLSRILLLWLRTTNKRRQFCVQLFLSVPHITHTPRALFALPENCSYFRV